MRVVDTSAFVFALVSEGSVGSRARRAVSHDDVAAPEFLDLELRNNVTMYDAAYVALAEALGAILVTADGRLARATGPRCET